MGPSYPHEIKNVTDEPLSDADLLSIARIVRGVAEMENCIECFIAKVAGVSETQAQMLLGRSQLNNKITAARNLAALRTDKAVDHFLAIDTPEFRASIAVRHAIAHGVYIGKIDGKPAFRTNQFDFDADKKQLQTNIVSYDSKYLAQLAEFLSFLVPRAEDVLRVRALRGKRLQQDLQPHPKARKPSSKTKGAQPPPPPSGE